MGSFDSDWKSMDREIARMDRQVKADLRNAYDMSRQADRMIRDGDRLIRETNREMANLVRQIREEEARKSLRDIPYYTGSSISEQGPWRTYGLDSRVDQPLPLRGAIHRSSSRSTEFTAKQLVAIVLGLMFAATGALLALGWPVVGIPVALLGFFLMTRSIWS